MECRKEHPPTTKPARKVKIIYKWVQGENIEEYNTSAQKWKAHTSTTEFREKFDAVYSKYTPDNNLRAEKIENFLIEEATAAEVVTKRVIKESANPNKWEKHLAPWYNAECKEAKSQCRSTRKKFGNNSPPAKAAYRKYRKCCAKNRAQLQTRLPNIIKYKPKEFWKMLKTKDDDISALNLKEFTEYN